MLMTIQKHSVIVEKLHLRIVVPHDFNFYCNSLCFSKILKHNLCNLIVNTTSTKLSTRTVAVEELTLQFYYKFYLLIWKIAWR